MFESSFLLPAGVLAHLERLETQESKSRKKLEESQNAQALEARIHELKRLRDKLRAEVKQRQARVSRSVIDIGRLSWSVKT